MSDVLPTELVAKLLGFSSAYPEDMFPPLTKAEIAELPRGILDRASAAMGRHVAKFAKEAADAVEAQHREIERLTRAVESSGLKRLQADIERDAAVDDVAHLAGVIVGYVRARRDGLGEVAHWWWELQQIANKIAAPRVASGASIAGVSPSPAPLAPQSVEALRDYAVLDGERLQSLWADIDRVKRENAELRAELGTLQPWRTKSWTIGDGPCNCEARNGKLWHSADCSSLKPPADDVGTGTPK
jgi:hypothetical protein